MNITFKLITSLILIITIVAAGFSFWQSKQEKIRLTNELGKRAELLADSLDESILPLLERGSFQTIKRYVTKFSNRERLLGIAIYNTDNQIIAASPKLIESVQYLSSSLLADIQKQKVIQLKYEDILKNEYSRIYAFSRPILINNQIAYVLTLYYDMDYITARVNYIWFSTFWRALLQILFISFATILILYIQLMVPIKKTTEWIKKIRLGETLEKLQPSSQHLLGPLANEITKMAKSLENSRLAAEREARLRLKNDAVWTAERLKEFVKINLQNRQIYVVSNREPCMHFKKGKEIEWIVPASGLITAIEPVLKACGGTWIAQGAGSGDRDTVDEFDRLQVPPDEPQYTLRRVWITPEEEQGYYYGFSNEGIWPLCHIAHTRPIFRAQDWEDYQRVNQKFADAVLEEIQNVKEPFILIQDYHFALLPALIKTKRSDARVSVFWHIPWPNPESFGICPWQKELLTGMLGADLIGFHTQFHCNNFIESIDRFLESRTDYAHFTVNRDGHTTWIKPFPISIATNNNANSNIELPSLEALLKPYGINANIIAVGVDRLDYTKGIVERFLSVEQFLQINPEYIGKFTFVELGAPSRTLIPKYQEFITDVEKQADRINDRFKKKNWKPILLLKKHHRHEDIESFYKRAALCMVTSLHDGMNLVAKEFVRARTDQKGVLILSQFTGAARDFQDALIINPYDIMQVANAIKIALTMPIDEQQERMLHMQKNIEEHNIYRWASDFITELNNIRLDIV